VFKDILEVRSDYSVYRQGVKLSAYSLRTIWIFLGLTVKNAVHVSWKSELVVRGVQLYLFALRLILLLTAL